jgi:type II secretory pathway pseudopilin PulG
MKKVNFKKNKGMLIIETLVFGSIVICIVTALASWTAVSIKAGRSTLNREQAFQAAEAGIEYYRWHLAHSPQDYQDGTGASGPYIHNLKDKDGNTVGQFSLDITSPSVGSTLVQINSTGTSQVDTNVKRKILSRVAKPSIAKYAFAGNDAMRFGEGTEVFGPLHSNGGIRFDGIAHNVVTSGSTTYNDADHTGNNEIGVHTHVNVPPQTGINDTYRSLESNPNSIPTRTDVFEAGRLISQPTIDFSGFTTDFATLKSKAVANGFYRDAAGSGYVGYHVVLKTNNTFDLYKINSWSSLGNCSSSTYSWSVGSETIQGNYSFPANGIIFIQDHVVVNGQIDSARLTITAATLPVPSDTTKFKNIIINNDLSYTHYDGTDSIGLIGQGGVMVGMKSEDDLKIDGALIAQNNTVGRFYYSGNNCTYKNRLVISLYGMIASHARYGFAYTDGKGYDIRNISYDSNMLYAPPPDFPLTSDQYQILSWEEVKN